MTARTTDNLKSQGAYREAGANAFRNAEGRDYGAHFGMRSDRAQAIADFQAGYDDEAKAATAAPILLTEGTKIIVNGERFEAMMKAKLLAVIGHTPMGWPLYGIDGMGSQGDMIECVIGSVEVFQ